jgi:hypothetical protein
MGEQAFGRSGSVSASQLSVGSCQLSVVSSLQEYYIIIPSQTFQLPHLPQEAGMACLRT